MPTNPDHRLKSEYGGIKAALMYCVESGMNKKQTATFLQIDIKTLRNRAERFGVTFTDGYATRDMTLVREVNSARMKATNAAGITGGRRRWQK